MPFREAHGIVGGLARAAIERGVSLAELSDDEMSDVPKGSRKGVRAALAAGQVLESKVSEGGTSSPRLAEQLELARRSLDSLTG